MISYATANDLPAEIWFLIARDLIQNEVVPPVHEPKPRPPPQPLGTPLDDILDREPAPKCYKRSRTAGLPFSSLSKYMGVNRHLFNFYLDSAYEEVEWTRLDGRMKGQLEQLQSPSIGRRVRKLKIRAWFIDQIMKQEREREGQPRTTTNGLLASAFEALQLKFLPSALTHHSEKQPNGEDSSSTSSTSILRLMVAAVNNMRDVVYYSLELRDLGLTKDSKRFFEIARLTMASTLRRLALHGTVFKLTEHVASFTDCRLLEDLELRLDYHSHITPGSAPHDVLASKQQEAEALQEVIVPFINSRKDTLRSFSLVSNCSVNLSHFFRSLVPLLRLRCLSIKACLDEAHLSDVNALVQFLHNHRFSLLHLDVWPLIPDLGESWTSSGDAIQRKNKSWERVLAALVRSENALPALEGLHLPFTGSTDLSMQLIRRASHSLTHLSLMDRALHVEEVKQVMALFAQRPFQLKSLLIEVAVLRIDLVRLLANRLPGLQSLVLLYDRVVWDTKNAFELQPSSVRQLHISLCVPLTQHTHILFELQHVDCSCNDVLRDLKEEQLEWNLKNITVLPRKNARVSLKDAQLLGYGASSESTDTGLAEMIAKKIPSITSLDGIRWHRDVFIR